MDVPLRQRELVGVEYPGTVVNVKKMMEQFGGEKKVFNTLKDPTKRMELHFRPGDPFGKPIYGDKFPTNSLILEVVRRRKKRRGQTDAEPVEESYSVKFVGFVNTVFKFKALCDFQLLPAWYKEDGTAESLIPKLVPNGLLPASWMEENVPLFITPVLYSRFDGMQNFYTEGVKVVKKGPDAEPVEPSRKKRPTFAVCRSFESQDSCDAPSPESLGVLQLYPQQMLLKGRIEKLYEERPIWSKVALVYRLNSDSHHIRYALTTTAYRFTNGPWRTLWVKFGYDPRKDPKSKIYQLMDFRVKSSIRLENMDQSRVKSFDYYMLPMKSQKQTSKTSLLSTENLLSKENGEKDDEPKKTPSYILLAGQLPSMRQCYYQLCDIYIDEVQKLIHQNDGLEQLCHEKDGWCDVGIIERCREVIARQIEAISLQHENQT